ncbi:hypothetical protein MNBD_GAMMA26-266 [hydrothermal vent metagenome]|uniref:Uncharacterized protein n=1 Tax=hydrothermal vent metagenome TaxID=652676 RepID=A0A3B1B598_9ZZZZ
MISKTVKISVTGLALCLAGTLQASEYTQKVTDVLVQAKATVDAIGIYRQPHVPRGAAADNAKNCRELEYEMQSTVPNTYSYKPDLYDDPAMGVSFWVRTIYSEAAMIFWYGAVVEFEENTRVVSAEDRVETLRRLKAEKRCFER